MARLARVSLLLFGSGFCALIYQTAWMRMFRLLFGASTASTSATLAVFMGGLGLGGYLLSRWVDRHPRPLQAYANLELGVSALAIVSIGLFQAVTALYHSTGGSQVLGMPVATMLRMLLAIVVMGPAVFLMGATLPAASLAVTSASDAGRTNVAVLLGINTLGAFAGVLSTTFVLLEVLGTTTTLLGAALLNALVGLAARSLARGSDGDIEPADAPQTAPEASRAAPLGFVLVAAAVVGFAFMLMELVWYRMLGPILGGSTYTFGIVLAMALLGLGLGGALYAFGRRQRVGTLQALAFTCALEALALLVPWALGDRLALFAGFLRLQAMLGFSWLILTWLLVTCVVVLPVAVVAGYQFPLLIALLGKGREDIGRQVAWTYAANTLGSILGALAGGFGLIPLLGASVAWKAVGVALLLVSAAALSFSVGRQGFFAVRAWGVTAVTAGFACLCFIAEGPTAVWRHSGIGAGRALLTQLGSSEDIKDWMRTVRRELIWEEDGVESSVALIETENGLSFLVNGKSDGNSLGDAGTQVMSGLLVAAMHPNPRHSLVIGLGTGSTAGWLARVPQMERVDVSEIEPLIVEVARQCASVNEDVLNNPKVKIHLEDAREMLMTSPQRYDIIFSEPSNPYRAGLASFYTREFYEAAKAHLNQDGIFLHWLQGYEVDASTVRSVLLTMKSVFPYVDVWATMRSDLVLRGSFKPPTLSTEALAQTLAREPYKRALQVAWNTEGLEGFLSHFVADDLLVSRLQDENLNEINTDDVNFVEFAFARSVGQSRRFSAQDLRQTAKIAQAERPQWLQGEVNWQKVLREREDAPKDAASFADSWRKNPFEPELLRDRLVLATGLAQLSDERALEVMAPLASSHPAERAAVETRLRQSQKKGPETLDALLRWVQIMKSNPWCSIYVEPEVIFVEAVRWVAENRLPVDGLFDALEKPFASGAMGVLRKNALVYLADTTQSTSMCQRAYSTMEPHTPWNRDFLQFRLRCYEATQNSRLGLAQADWSQFMKTEPLDLKAVISTEPRGASGLSDSVQ